MQDSSRAGDGSGYRESSPSEISLVEAVGRLSAESAHELNNQISVILNYTFILLRQLPEDSPLREHIPEMQTAAWRASSVAQELLAFGGPRIVEPESLDLAAVVNGVRSLIAHALEQETEIEIVPSHELRRVKARQPHIEWLLVELALHAKRMLGQVEHFSLALCNEDLDDAHHVVLEARATPPHSSAAQEVITTQHAFVPRAFPASAAQLPGAELALAHTRGKLSTTRMEDGAVVYRLTLPAED